MGNQGFFRALCVIFIYRFFPPSFHPVSFLNSLSDFFFLVSCLGQDGSVRALQAEGVFDGGGGWTDGSGEKRKGSEREEVKCRVDTCLKGVAQNSGEGVDGGERIPAKYIYKYIALC